MSPPGQKPPGRRAAVGWLGLLAGVCLATAAGAEPPPAVVSPDPSLALRFAEQLYAERDYYRAITEYKRFLFLLPRSPLSDWVRLRIGQSYLDGSRFSAAQGEFEALWRRALDPRLRNLAGVALARSLYLDGRLLQSEALLADLLPGLGDVGLRGTAWYLAGCARLRQGELGRARQAFDHIWAGHPLAERAFAIVTRLDAGGRLPRKSPVLAGLLSLVPGLGHFYLEEYSTGLTALAWNGLFATATFEAFRHRQWGVGALLAALELLWYSGSIYGAVSGAERYNRDAVRNYLEGLDEMAGLDVPVPDDRQVHAILLQGSF